MALCCTFAAVTRRPLPSIYRWQQSDGWHGRYARRWPYSAANTV